LKRFPGATEEGSKTCTKLKKQYGNVLTYEEGPLAHVKTEFGFDVLEVAQGL
jgi:hypothetical protein